MQRRRGVSLAKGPIALVGLLGIIYGLTALIVRAHGFTLHFPNGHVHGQFWLHLKVNGWTALLFIAAGLALLFSAAAHITAKSMALIVGIVMIVLAIIGYAQKHGVLGIFAANHWTELIWGIAGVVLILLALMPRVGGGTTTTEPAATTQTRSRREVADDRARDRADDRPASSGRTENAESGSTGAVRSRSADSDGEEPLVHREQTVSGRGDDDA
jgi:hypothetical protein